MRAAAAAGRDGDRRDVRAHPGGKGANQAVRGGPARRGRCASSAASDDDAFADEALAGLRDVGVELDREHAGDAPTGVALITWTPRARTRSSSRRARTRAAARARSSVDGAASVPARDPAPRSCGRPPSRRRSSASTRRRRDRRRRARRRGDLVVVNRYELEALPEPPRPARGDARRRGRSAARARPGGRAGRPPQVDAVDGTAAGDAFTACLVVSLLEGRDREEALGARAPPARSRPPGPARSRRCRPPPSWTRYSPAEAGVRPARAAARKRLPARCRRRRRGSPPAEEDDLAVPLGIRVARSSIMATTAAMAAKAPKVTAAAARSRRRTTPIGALPPTRSRGSDGRPPRRRRRVHERPRSGVSTARRERAASQRSSARARRARSTATKLGLEWAEYTGSDLTDGRGR